MSAYLAIIAGIIKFANYISAGLQQHHDEVNGANKQKVQDHAGQKEVLDKLVSPIGAAESDSLWGQNKARFGTSTGEH